MSNRSSQPWPSTHIIRALIGLLIAISLVAGYYHASLAAERKKYAKLEDNYVRIRDQIGRDEAQRLIDLSHQNTTE